MKVIFLKDIPRVAKRHEIKEVNDGYAQNFLFPKKLAEPATMKTVNALEQKKKEVALNRSLEEQTLLQNLEAIKGAIVKISGKANDQGHLFSAIHSKEIVDALKIQNKIEINEEFLVLEKPIKEIGEFEIPVSIKNKKSSFKLIVSKI